MIDFDDVISQVNAASRHGFLDKADAVDYYQNFYGFHGKGKAIPWKQHIVSDILGLRDVRQDIIGRDQYKKEYKNLSKRFESRLHTPEPKNKKEYQDLGKALGIIRPPKGGYHVHYEGGIQFSECEPVSFDIDITGDLAEAVAKDPASVVSIAIMLYMQLEGEDEDTIPGACDEGQPIKITVTANEDDYKPPSRKRHKPAIPFFKR